jgi:hypothetical protein
MYIFVIHMDDDDEQEDIIKVRQLFIYLRISHIFLFFNVRKLFF